MNKKILFGRSIKDLLISVGPSLLLFLVAIVVAYKFLDPSPPKHLVIATGDNEGDYQTYAKEYKKILHRDGIELEIRSTQGPLENLKILEDDDADVDVGFVQDGLGSLTEQPDLVSLGSMYYEPLWIFYRGTQELTKLSQLKGRKLAVGGSKRGTRIIATQLLEQSGVTEKNAQFVNIGMEEAAAAIESGKVDVAFFLLTPWDSIIDRLADNKNVRLMSLDQAEAIARLNPSLHHVVFPHGAFNLTDNHPAKDTDLVASTATLLVRDDLHPGLTYLLLKAAEEVHSLPGIFEKRGEFPVYKDDSFPLSEDAAQFYKSGGTFWQRYLPFWMAALVDRFLLVVIPLFALVIPLIKMVPRLYNWRIRRRIYHRYGELKFLETQASMKSTKEEKEHFLEQLDAIEERVNRMKLPLLYTEHLYSLRGHIHFVRSRLS